MNDEDDFLDNQNIDEEIDLDEIFSKAEIENNEMSFPKIKDVCLANPFYKRLDFDDEDYNFLNICYDCTDFQTVNSVLNRHSARRKYQFSYTLLMAIICNPHISEKQKCYMIEKLINLGTDINHRNIFGETALYLAVLSHQKLVVDCLLKNGANPNISGIHSISPLMIACYFANSYIASLLIHYGADINAKSTFTNWKVMDFAMIPENPDFELMMRSLGAKGGIGYNLLT